MRALACTVVTAPVLLLLYPAFLVHPTEFTIGVAALIWSWSKFLKVEVR